MILYILLAILIFGLLIMIHEFGHYVAARIFRVEESEAHMVHAQSVQHDCGLLCGVTRVVDNEDFAPRWNRPYFAQAAPEDAPVHEHNVVHGDGVFPQIENQPSVREKIDVRIDRFSGPQPADIDSPKFRGIAEYTVDHGFQVLHHKAVFFVSVYNADSFHD